MRTRGKLLLTAVTAAIVLGSLIAGAGARRFQLSNQNFRAVWEDLRTIAPTVGFNIGCSVTLEGSFHSRTISKVCGQLIGYVTRAILRHVCETNPGEVWILNGTETQEGITTPNTLPWHIRYGSFAGILPRITRLNIQVIGTSLLTLFAGIKCLYRSTTAAPTIMEFEVIEGKLERLRHNEGTTIPIKEEMLGCEPSVRLAHDAPVTLLGSTTTRINISLVQ
jgi:hypothetical protein